MRTIWGCDVFGVVAVGLPLIVMSVDPATPPPVPELTRSASIQLNERLSLRRKAKVLACSAPDIAPPDLAWRSRRAIILRPAALFLESRS